MGPSSLPAASGSRSSRPGRLSWASRALIRERLEVRLRGQNQRVAREAAKTAGPGLPGVRSPEQKAVR